MNTFNHREIISLLVIIVLVIPGCASLGTAIAGSAFGVAGQQGISYFVSGKAEKIFYSEMDQLTYAVEKSFYSLSMTMEKKERHHDGSIHYEAKTQPPRDVDVEISLKPLSEGITEIAVVSRKGILPDRAVCHTLMKNVEDNINHTSR